MKEPIKDGRIVNAVRLLNGVSDAIQILLV
jgi:hypothetical protein